MYIKSITLKNFLSYGEIPVKIQFDRHVTNLLTGLNGQGKSSIIEGLTFVFYGKSFRDIKKDLLINTTNGKNSLTECELIGNNGKEVLIRRGIKPNIFEIYENGVLVNQNAESRDYQSYLETHIIGMNFITFTQTVIISKTRYTPFMKLKAGERRAFVESILNLSIFGDMQKLQAARLKNLKEEESNLKTDIKILDNDFANKIDSLKRYKAMVDKIKQESEDNIAEEISQLHSRIEDENKEIEKLKRQLDNTDYSVNANNYKKLENSLLSNQSKLDIHRNNLGKLNSKSDKCSMCGNKIDISHIETHKEDLNKKCEDIESLIIRIKAKMDELRPDYESFNNQQSHNYKIQTELKNCSRIIIIHEENISELKSKKLDTSEYDDTIVNLKTELLKMKSRIASLKAEYQEKLVEIDTNNYVYSLLKDSGIKAAIIQNSIPTINKIINEYLQKFGFFINFELDSEFNETIHVRGVNKLTYNSFSEGEKLRIDLSLILAWREISLLQSGMSSNLLFFDEITDASMDADGVELFIKAINALKNTNTWIISHTPEKLENYVRGFINLSKVDGFTTINVNK